MALSQTHKVTIAAALITASATLLVGLVGFVKTKADDQPATITNIVNNGFQVFGNFTSAAPVNNMHAEPARNDVDKRSIQPNESIRFDGDVTISVTHYKPGRGSKFLLNGKTTGWRKPGSRFTAKRQLSANCYVDFVSVEKPTDSNQIPVHVVEYFCRSN